MFELEDFPETALELRRNAAQATLDKFAGLPFSFEGGRDCAKMTVFHLKQLRLPIKIGKVAAYKTALSARAALRKQFGVDTLPEVCDKFFERIPASMAIVGDIIQAEGDGPLGALTISLGNDLVISYHEDAVGAVTGRLVAPAIAAWRTLPL